MLGNDKQSDAWSSADKLRIIIEAAALNDVELGLSVRTVQRWQHRPEDGRPMAGWFTMPVHNKT